MVRGDERDAGMRRIVVACMLMGPAAWAAPGPFDGKWVGTAPEAGDCGVLTVTLMVADNLLTGTVSGKKGSPPIVATSLGSDGAAKVRYAQFEGSLRLSGAQFTGSFNTFCGMRSVTGAKVNQ
jgi:hypothetical protein